MVLHIAVDPATGEELDFVEVPPDLSGINFNEKSGRLVGGFATLTFVVNVWAFEIGVGDPLLTLEQTADVLAQHTVGGGAHFAMWSAYREVFDDFAPGPGVLGSTVEPVVRAHPRLVGGFPTAVPPLTLGRASPTLNEFVK